MTDLRVKNWDKFQHYKKRDPPWIKLHRELLNDYAFSKLADATRSHLIGIWLLAAGRDGTVPDDADWIASKLLASEKVDLESLVSHGFLIMSQSASKMLATQLHQTETETETETENVVTDVTTADAAVENSQRDKKTPGDGQWNDRLAPLCRRAGGERHVSNWLAWSKRQIGFGVSVDELEARIGGLCELRDRSAFEHIQKGANMTPAVFERQPELRDQCEAAWSKYGPSEAQSIIDRLGVKL